MSAANKKRGATAIRSQSSFPRQHLWIAAGLSIAVILTATLIPSENVEANRPAVSALASETIEGKHDAISSDALLSEIAVVSTPLLPEAEEPEPEPQWAEHTVGNGDNLSLIFSRAGFSDRDVYNIVNKGEGGKALTRIFPGQTIAFLADDAGDLQALKHIVSPLETTVYELGDSGFSSRKEVRSPEVRTTWATGVIESSLFMAGTDAGLSNNLIMEVANIFGGVIDFVLDPRQGDTMHVLYEQLYLDGERYGDGNVIAAAFTNQGKTFNAFRYTDANGDSNFYNEEGVSMRKAFLMAPLDFTRISGNFNPRRMHPIYKTVRPHRGTDYAAPRGTPVFAAGDGRVIAAGYTKPNGNYVFIQHGEQYVTKYLHLHKRKVSKGQRVSQSQIIGTVGSTGAATGPHLHYEFLVNGVHRNPRTIHRKLPKAKTLPEAEMPTFLASISAQRLQLAALNTEGTVALSDNSAPESPANTSP